MSHPSFVPFKKTIAAVLAVAFASISPVAHADTEDSTSSETSSETATQTADTATDDTENEELPDLTNSGKWISTSGRWWWSNADGSWPASQRVRIKGSVYSFDANGYMQTGWLQIETGWIYFSESGSQVFGWAKVNGTWYYLNPETGIMVTGVQKINGTTYTFR